MCVDNDEPVYLHRFYAAGSHFWWQAPGIFHLHLYA